MPEGVRLREGVCEVVLDGEGVETLERVSDGEHSWLVVLLGDSVPVLLGLAE